MFCRNCGSQNVAVYAVQTAGKMRGHSRGCLWSLGRLTLIIMTCGLWLLVGKSKGSGRMTYKNESMAVCQNCGYRRNVS